jgi:hypothetical protein
MSSRQSGAAAPGYGWQVPMVAARALAMGARRRALKKDMVRKGVICGDCYEMVIKQDFPTNLYKKIESRPRSKLALG